VAQNFVTIN